MIEMIDFFKQIKNSVTEFKMLISPLLWVSAKLSVVSRGRIIEIVDFITKTKKKRLTVFNR